MSKDDTLAWFVRGETPLGWLDHAGRLGRDEFVVAAVAWLRHGLDGDLPVGIPEPLLNRFGLAAGDVDRAVRRLEEAGLVRVSRALGAPVRVTVQPVPSGVQTPRQPPS